MSQWSHNHPEEMAEIASLPSSQQNAELRHAIGYDPDRIRDEQKERLRENLETFADAASLPSQHFIRCEPSEGGCGARFRKDLDACPLCQWSLDED